MSNRQKTAEQRHRDYILETINPLADYTTRGKKKRPAANRAHDFDIAFLCPCRLLVAEYLPVANVDDAVGILGDVMLVGDENDVVALLVESVEQRHDLDAGLGVEVARGLVGENDRRTD